MSDRLLTVSVLLAYGPFLLMLSLYIAAVVLRLMGWPELLRTLIAKTGPQPPIPRNGSDAH